MLVGGPRRQLRMKARKEGDGREDDLLRLQGLRGACAAPSEEALVCCLTQALEMPLGRGLADVATIITRRVVRRQVLLVPLELGLGLVVMLVLLLLTFRGRPARPWVIHLVCSTL